MQSAAALAAQIATVQRAGPTTELSALRLGGSGCHTGASEGTLSTPAWPTLRFTPSPSLCPLPPCLVPTHFPGVPGGASHRTAYSGPRATSRSAAALLQVRLRRGVANLGDMVNPAPKLVRLQVSQTPLGPTRSFGPCNHGRHRPNHAYDRWRGLRCHKARSWGCGNGPLEQTGHSNSAVRGSGPEGGMPPALARRRYHQGNPPFSTSCHHSCSRTEPDTAFACQDFVTPRR